MVEANYPGLNPNLKGAAALSVFAHVEDLIGKGAITCEGAPSLESTYRLA